MDVVHNANDCLFKVIIPGFNHFVENYADAFLKKSGLPRIGGKRSAHADEDFKEDIGLLLDHRQDMLSAVKASPELCAKNPCVPKTAADYLTDFSGLKEIFAALSPASTDTQPLIKDRNELVDRCRKQEARAFSGRSRPTADPYRQGSELIQIAYKIVGFKPGTPPGNGTLDDHHHGFEFAFLLQVLAYLEVNRDRFQKAAETGSFSPAVVETLKGSARQYGFVEEAVQFLPQLGLMLIKPKEYLIKDVINFRYAVSKNTVALEWDLPADYCDSVILERRPTTKTEGNWQLLFDKKLRHNCRDEIVGQAGERFEYRVRSVYKGFTKEDGPALSVWLPDEPVLVKPPEWKLGVITLAWKPGNNSEQTLIFRQEGTPPIPSPGTHIASLAPETTIFEDKKKVSPGKSYYYLLVARYPGGVSSQGVATRVIIPAPPPPPKRVAADYLFDKQSGNSEVVIKIHPAPGSPPVTYTILRYDYSKGKIDESTDTLIQSDQNAITCKDQKVAPGKCYVYRAIPSYHGISGVHQDSAAVPIVPGVMQLRFQRDDRAIIFFYKVNAAVKEVVVRRGGTKLVASREHARDTGLINGQKYDYNFACVYKFADGEEYWSKMEELKGVSPRIPPEAVTLEARVEDV